MSYVRSGIGIVLVWTMGCNKPTSMPGDAAAPASGDAAAPAGIGLPADPKDWVCPGTQKQFTDDQIKAYCEANPLRGLEEVLGAPPLLSHLDEKNKYDEALSKFLNSNGYRRLGWWGDANWRLTGPCVGDTPGHCDESYGVHPAVRVWYSPAMSNWLCGNHVGPVPDGASIIKEMRHLNQESVSIGVDSSGCMTTVTPTKDEAQSWAVAIKSSYGSFDGWYWFGVAKDANGNPPISDRSAFVDGVNYDSQPPSKPNPAWFPTGDLFGAQMGGGLTNVANVVYPYNMHGNYCVNCHASGQSESTFADLANVMSPGILYRWFKAEPGTRAPLAEPGEGAHRRRPKQAPPPAVQQAAVATDAKDADVYQSPFPPPLSTPSTPFASFFNQLRPVPFADAWKLRMPAETYDHVAATASFMQYTPIFLTSDQCIGCHDATFSNNKTPNMMLEVKQGAASHMVNLSPYGEWRASPMGLAGRDPIFFSQLESENNNLPDKVAPCIESTCLHCHGVMGQRQYAYDTGPSSDECKNLFGVPPDPKVPFGKPFRRDMVKQWPGDTPGDAQKYGALARDGISCDVCHHITNDDFGQEASYTGNFVSGDSKKVFGPYGDNVKPKPMAQALGVEPAEGAQIKDSRLCGTCHNILLPVLKNDGSFVTVGNKFAYEQSTHLEWTNSAFGPGQPQFEECQDCHMPKKFHRDDKQNLQFKIANIESADEAPTTHRLADADITLTPRPFSRHSLHGLNVFLNEMFEQFPLLLGVRQIDYMTGTVTPAGTPVTPPLITGRDSMLAMAKQETADLAAPVVTKNGSDLHVTVTVVNKVGHYLPSGVGFRRLFLEVTAEDGQGNVLWASGRTNEVGAILKGRSAEPLASELPLKNPKAYELHHTTINKEDQAQIYEEVVADSTGAVTTSFLRRVTMLKDNRLRPVGFDPAKFTSDKSPYVQELGKLYGVQGDPNYTDPKQTGHDTIEYVMHLDPQAMSAVARVTVTLWSQSIPPAYLEQRFADASVGPKKQDDIRRLFYITSQLDAGVPDSGGQPFLRKWKLEIASAQVAVPR